MGNQQRRVTSQRLLSQSRFSTSAKPLEKTGNLKKFSPALLRGWQTRHVELKDGILKYFKEVGGGMQNQGTLNFDLYCCAVTQSPKKKDQFSITFSGNEREFWFKAANEAEALQWISALTAHIKFSEGFLKKSIAPKTSEFWRQEQISEKQLVELADTFDILLFSCNTSGGKIIRTYTGSEFGKSLI